MQGVLFQPTDEQRRLVRAFSGFGIPQDDIARHIDIEPKTLRRHFRDELDCGAIEATAKVAQSLFQMATTGKNVAAAIFWMKARAQWKEKHEVQISRDPLDGMSHEELSRELDALLEQRKLFASYRNPEILPPGAVED